MIEQLLKQLNWSDKEIRVYTSLLKLGPSSVRSLAQKSGVNRGTTYDVLKSLQARGIVSFYEKTSKQFFIAEDPAQIIRDLKNKKAQLEEAEQQIQEALPELRALRDNGSNKPVSRLYEGLDGIKVILNDVLNKTATTSNKTYYAYSATTPRSHIYTAFPQFTQERIKQNISTKVISLAPGGELHGLDERKSLQLPKTEAETYTFIYSDSVAYISQTEAGQPVGMIIDNKDIYITQKQIFKSLWKKL